MFDGSRMIFCNFEFIRVFWKTIEVGPNFQFKYFDCLEPLFAPTVKLFEIYRWEGQQNWVCNCKYLAEIKASPFPQATL